MKESNLDECFEKNSSLCINKDKVKVHSLIDKAKGRNVYLKENNASYIFEGYYSSTLEMLHALVILNGYKVSNHICLGYYLRDVLERNDLFRIFDDCRFKINSLIYYGIRMEFEIAKEAIQKYIKLMKKLKNFI